MQVIFHASSICSAQAIRLGKLSNELPRRLLGRSACLTGRKRCLRRRALSSGARVLSREQRQFLAIRDKIKFRSDPRSTSGHANPGNFWRRNDSLFMTILCICRVLRQPKYAVGRQSKRMSCWRVTMASMKFSGLIDQNHSMRMAAATSSYVKWKIVRRERERETLYNARRKSSPRSFCTPQDYWPIRVYACSHATCHVYIMQGLY